MEKVVITEKDCNNWKFSSNTNEVIRPVLNFLQKDFAQTKEHKKAQKTPKRNQTKAQNANDITKIKNMLKKHLEKVTYSLICVFVFFVRAKKKKIEIKKMKQCNVLNPNVS